MIKASRVPHPQRPAIYLLESSQLAWQVDTVRDCSTPMASKSVEHNCPKPGLQISKDLPKGAVTWTWTTSFLKFTFVIEDKKLSTNKFAHERSIEYYQERGNGSSCGTNQRKMTLPSGKQRRQISIKYENFVSLRNGKVRRMDLR